MPRDYLAEAARTIFSGALPLVKLLETDPAGVIGNLTGALSFEGSAASAVIRESAAYALGQIGDPGSAGPLRARYATEREEAVKDAIVAAATAINLAPTSAGFSQAERGQIIDDVYHGRRPADW